MRRTRAQSKDPKLKISITFVFVSVIPRRDGFDTLVEITSLPVALTVPEQAQVKECYEVVFAEVFRILKDEFACSLRPFDHETMIFQGSLAI